jgi:uncharacterized protein (TIGR02118 family)
MLKAAATLGFSAVLPYRASAAAAEIGMRCLTVLYPNGEDVKFDFDYYRDKHLTLIMGLYGKTIKRFELRRAVTAAGQPKPPYVAAVNIWVADLPAFEALGAQHSQTLIADVPNFTNSMPIIQNEEIYGVAGADLSAPALGNQCLTIAYPNSEGARFDPDYYRDKHLTLIMDLYGERAIKRFEMRKGLSAQDGSKAPFVATVNIYVNDAEVFAAAGARHGDTLRNDVPNFSSVTPSAQPTEIYGLANT